MPTCPTDGDEAIIPMALAIRGVRGKGHAEIFLSAAALAALSGGQITLAPGPPIASETVSVIGGDVIAVNWVILFLTLAMPPQSFYQPPLYFTTDAVCEKAFRTRRMRSEHNTAAI